MDPSNLWIMIPARGGSQAVPRKNVRLLAGTPLIAYAIRTAMRVCPPGRIIVITDDDEIDAVSTGEGVRVIREEQTTGRATLDEVAMKVLAALDREGIARDDDIFLTIQPTCPFVESKRIQQAMAAFEAGAGSVITVTDDRHLGWRLDQNERPVPDYKARVNRQQLEPRFRESGAIIGCQLADLRTHRTRIVEPIRLMPLDKEEALDIDDFSDWAIAEYVASRRTIVIRADASEALGMGHIYRALAIAQELARHKVKIATDGAKPLGRVLLSQYPFELVEVDGNEGFIEFLRQTPSNLIILDQLDTSLDYMRKVRATADRVVTFEDMGPGATEADLLVSDLYKNLEVPEERQLSGIGNAILAPNFETDVRPAPFRTRAEHILVVFGGTDPARLTEKALEALAGVRFAGTVSVVLGPGIKRRLKLDDFGLSGELHSNVKYMPGIMRKADIAISSAGRTVTELLSFGLPVVCLCQNEKELTHTHASARFGVINLGLGELVDTGTLAAHISRLTQSSELREILRARALHETAGRANAKVIRQIIGRIGWAS